MKVIYYVVMISMLFLPRCSSVYPIHHTESSYIVTNKRIQGKEASITLASGQIIKGRYISIRIDSTSWIEVKSQSRQIVPTSDVTEIAISNSGKGALKGFGLGILGGGCAGFLIGSTQEGEWHEFVQFFGMLIGAGAGGTVGLVIGAIRGDPDKYILRAPIDTTYIDIAEKVAQEAAETWLVLVDSAKVESWNEATQIFKQRLTRQQWETKLQSFQITFGKIETRKFKSAEYSRILIDDAIKEKVVIEYESSFEKKKTAVETIALTIDRDGQWKVS